MNKQRSDIQKTGINTGTDTRYDIAVSIAKVIAMLLIINSHSDVLFPKKLSFLATGGALGNELFFLTGGFLFKVKNDSFVSFCWKRYIRLYIPTYLMTVFLFIIGYIHLQEFNSVKEIFHLLIWPSQFWFVSAIFVFGIIQYFLVKTNLFQSTKVFTVYTCVFAGIVILMYWAAVPNKTEWIVEDARLFNTTVYFKCIYSFYVFTLGYYLKVNKGRWETRKNKGIWTAAFLASFILFYGFKYLISKKATYMPLQIISQFITVVCVVSLFIALEKWVRINKNRIVRIINFLSRITLESFLVQFQVIGFIAGVEIGFPMNYLSAVILILSISYLFHIVNTKICGCIIDK